MSADASFPWMSVIESNNATDAQREAAKLQADANKSSQQVALDIWNQQQTNAKPWLTAGTSAINQLSTGVQPGGRFSQTQPTMEQLQMDPGYDWRVKQGENSLSAQASAMGNLGSGNLGTALVNYGQEAGSQEYTNAYNRWIQGQSLAYNELAGVAGSGQTAVNQLANQGNSYANNAMGLNTSTANAMSSSVINQSNIQNQYMRSVLSGASPEGVVGTAGTLIGSIFGAA